MKAPLDRANAQIAALRRPRTKLWRSVLTNGGVVRIGAMCFRHAMTDEEARDMLTTLPHHWWIRLAPDLWSQEVCPEHLSCG